MKGKELEKLFYLYTFRNSRSKFSSKFQIFLCTKTIVHSEANFGSETVFRVHGSDLENWYNDDCSNYKGHEQP
ncbi:hypothetical protein POVCU2_0016240 [Plasmodium ovale curtisi]|uniref:Uncharacterized protein n=1 Tax=Plasmodium ovale curtisi TaxID=864141 RepID=A0A1A8VUY1_PLAOA|nr:hypothetical protein POVCU2_0016240 [Plasmodium ovale curtisi]